MIEAAVERGVPHNDDPNAEEILGVGLTHMTVRNGRRMSTWTAFIEPIVDSRCSPSSPARRSRAWSSDGGGRAVGVRLSRPGKSTHIERDPAAPHRIRLWRRWPATELRCSGDVIVAGGVIGSPQLLLLSGIGRPTTCARSASTAGRSARVGANLHDHALPPSCTSRRRRFRGQGQQPRSAPVRRQRTRGCPRPTYSR